MDKISPVTSVSKETNKSHVSEWVQGTIWVISIASIPLYFKDIINQQQDSIKNTFTVIFGLVTLAQQISIYLDIHAFESNPDKAEKEYGDWINHWGEKILRYFIFIALLFGAGKITEAVYPWFACSGCVGTRGDFCELIKPDGINHNSLFVIGASSVFFLLLCWNGFALTFRKNDENQDKAKRNWITFRIILFTLSALFAFIFWIIILLKGSNAIGIFAMVSLVVYIITALISTLLSFDKILDFVVGIFRG
jgi:hypothetical protein